MCFYILCDWETNLLVSICSWPWPKIDLIVYWNVKVLLLVIFRCDSKLCCWGPADDSSFYGSATCTDLSHTQILHLKVFHFFLPAFFAVLFFPYPAVQGRKVKRSDDSRLLKPFTPLFTGYPMHMWVCKCSHVCLVQSRSLLRLHFCQKLFNFSIPFHPPYGLPLLPLPWGQKGRPTPPPPPLVQWFPSAASKGYQDFTTPAAWEERERAEVEVAQIKREKWN